MATISCCCSQVGFILMQVLTSISFEIKKDSSLISAKRAPLKMELKNWEETILNLLLHCITFYA